MQEDLTVLAGSALPTFMVLVGILLNRNDINRLDTQMNGLRGEMNGLRGEMNSLRGEFNALRSQMHSDMMMLMSTNGDFEMRISKLEERPSQQ
jgi:hypothetical protein